jgi:hypothetical protein
MQGLKVSFREPPFVDAAENKRWFFHAQTLLRLAELKRNPGSWRQQ